MPNDDSTTLQEANNYSSEVLELIESNMHRNEIAELRACVPIGIGFDGRFDCSYADNGKCPFIFFKLRGKINT